MIAVDLLILLLFAVLIKFLLFAIQRRKDLKAFQRLGISGPKPNFFSGNLYQLNRPDALPHEVIDEWISQFGNVFGYYIGERRHLVINDRDILRKIFLQSGSNFRNRPGTFLDVEPIKHSILFKKDEDWKRSRRVLQPVFGHNQVKSETIHQTITDCAERMIAAIGQYAKLESNGSILVPFYPRMQAASLDVIARTALNLETDVHDEKNTVLLAVKEYFSDAMNVAVNTAAVFPFLRPIMTFVNDHMTAGKMTDLAVAHVRKQIIAAAEQRQKGKHEMDETHQPPATTFLNALLRCLASGTLSEVEVIANAHLVLLAGYETTANSVTFLMYYLARNTEYQDRLRESFYNSDDEFFQMVWMESLRMVPPAPSLVVRTASHDIEIDGIRIEEDTVIEAPVWTIQHDPSIWPEPHKFDPYRFSEQNRKTLDPMAFLTFGAGARQCLGMSLATEEAKIIVQAILTNFIVTLPSAEPLKLKSQTSFLNPANSVNLLFTPINKEEQ